jgi:hypothetical protein
LLNEPQKIKHIKRPTVDFSPTEADLQMDADLRRAILSQLHLVKKRWPRDWRRIIAEVERP